MEPKDDAESYLVAAKRRAGRRRHAANLLLPLLKFPLMLGLWLLQVEVLYRLFKGGDCGGRALRCLQEGVPVIVFTMAPFFPAVGLSMILANFLLWLIPPVRRIFDREAAPFPETSFSRSQRKLAVFTAIAAAVAWPVMFIASRFI